MSAKVKVKINIEPVSCLDCIYFTDDDGVVFYCAKIKMHQPTKELKPCLIKQTK